MKVSIIAALSADGFIAPVKKEGEPSTFWTSKEDSQFFQKMTKESGVCVMGKNTFDTIGKPLPGRMIYVYAHDDLRFKIYDPRMVAPTTLEPKALIATLAEEGRESVMICGGSSVYTQFLEAGVVTDVYLTTEPKLFGDGVRLFSKEVEAKISVVERIELSEETLVTHYAVLQ